MKSKEEIKSRMIELNLQANILALRGRDVDGHKKALHYIDVLRWVLDEEERADAVCNGE